MCPLFSCANVNPTLTLTLMPTHSALGQSSAAVDALASHLAIPRTAFRGIRLGRPLPIHAQVTVRLVWTALALKQWPLVVQAIESTASAFADTLSHAALAADFAVVYVEALLHAGQADAAVTATRYLLSSPTTTATTTA